MPDSHKPQPFILDGRAYYTLSSYDPVSITVNVPYVTDADVDYMLNAAVAQAGGTAENLADPTWISAHFDGIADAAQLRDAVRAEIASANEQMAEASKPTLCAEELAKRLNQSVPADELARVRSGLEQAFAARLAQQGLTPEQFLAQTGGRQGTMDSTFDEQASELAEQQAAIDAYASKNHIKATREEMPGLLGVDPTQFEALASQAKTTGELDALQDTATRNKALDQVVSECTCTYHHETPEEAAARAAELQRLEEQARRAEEAMDLSKAGHGGGVAKPREPRGDDHTGPSEGPHLHLV